MKRTTMLASLAAFGALAAAAPVGAQTALKTVRVGVAEGDDATPTIYAAKTGIFAKYGLDVQVSAMNSGSASIAALAGGAVDIAGSVAREVEEETGLTHSDYRADATGIVWLLARPLR